ncbi:MAG: 4-alpha-glucanotransferase, partial [Eubacterium sp.]|nr:4-alpha-glucanotransferase [Eubacterium sp.]
MSEIIDMVKQLKRLSGILMHPTSLPGDFGIGDLGPAAYEFADFLKASGQHLWQTLPLGPTGDTDCPYQCYSSFAGQPLLISPELLIKDGLLAEEDIADRPAFPEDHVDYELVRDYKSKLFTAAYRTFSSLDPDAELIAEFENFCSKTPWLDDYAMFMAIRKSRGTHWLEWDKKYRKPTRSQKTVIARELSGEIRYECFLQWLFFRQWMALKAYANENGILLIGDIPIFVSGDSADVWSAPRMFQLDKDGFPTVVAGVPPDYFSATG